MTEQTAWLVLPARPEYLRFARITGASLAARLGFSYDDLEDLRLAVDETCFALLPRWPPPPGEGAPPGTAAGPEAAGPAAAGPAAAGTAAGPAAAGALVPGAVEPYLELRYLTTPTGIEVEAARRGGPIYPIVLSELGRRILAAVVDEFEVCPDTGRGETIWFRKSGPHWAELQGLRA